MDGRLGRLEHVVGAGFFTPVLLDVFLSVLHARMETSIIAEPLVRDRDAILPDTPNGQIRLDRVLAEEMRGQGRAVLARRSYEVGRVARERRQKEVASDE